MSNVNLGYGILKELFNISIGRAASLMSEIVNRKILLRVPDIEIVNLKNEKIKLDNYFPKVLDGTLMVSSISFEQKLTGKANLIFSTDKMRTFINLCLDKKETDKCYEMNFTDMDFDIIKEVGNIILNCIMGEIVNYLDISLNYALPEVKVFSKIDFNRDIENDEYMHALLLNVTFIIDNTEIEGAIVIDLTLGSLDQLAEKIKNVEDGLYE